MNSPVSMAFRMEMGRITAATPAARQVARPEEIEVVGEDVGGLNFGFQVADTAASRVGDLLWFSPFKLLQRLFFRTPLVYLFVFGSSFYHDYVWWPVVGKPV